MNTIHLREFRKANKISQQFLADFLGTNRSFLSLIEVGKSKLPNDKIDKIMSEGVQKYGWDVSFLNPLFYRLYELAEANHILSKSTTPFVFDWKTGQSELHITPIEMLAIKHGKQFLSDEIVNQIVEQIPNVNLNWLKFGTETMFGIQNVLNTETNPDESIQLFLISQRIKSLEERLARIEKILGL